MEADQMRLPDGTTLMHGKAPYDPVKAHEYYLRIRQLKGRKKGSGYTVNLGGGKTVQLSEQQLIEQRAYAAKRVNDIKTRLVELGTKLHKMMETTKRQANKTPTASDKAKAARESKQYREKHKQQLATKRRVESKHGSAKTKSKKDSVAELEHKIGQVKTNLRAAVAKQRALAAATRN